MKRKALIVALLVLAGFVVAHYLSPTAIEGQQKSTGKSPYVHSVVFYLKKDAPKGTVEELIGDSHKLLAKIPTVRGLWVGRPADKYTPKVTVTDYQVGLLVLFDDYAGLKTYLDHDLHTRYVDMHGKHLEKVLVYDFVNQAK
jgi:hypothetical protein